MQLKIFIDMDGVITDFLGGAASFFGYDNGNIHDHWPNGEWGTAKHIKKFFGVSERGFWEALRGKGFWRSLLLMPDAKEFLKFIKPYKPVILTSPALESADGKMLWIKDNLPSYWKDRRVILTTKKELVAGEGRILIDDHDENIKKWENAGGIGILYPRKWNKNWFIDNSLEVVKNEFIFYINKYHKGDA